MVQGILLRDGARQQVPSLVRVFQKGTETGYPFGGGTTQVYVFWLQRAEDDHLMTCATDGDIQPSPPTFPVQRPEIEI